MYQDTIDLYNSKDLLKLLTDYSDATDKYLVEEISNIYSVLNKEIVRYSNDEVLFLKDRKGIRRYKIKGYNFEKPTFSIQREYDTLNKKDVIEIKELFPLDEDKLVLKNGRVYYEEPSQCFELRLWTLVAERFSTNLHSEGLYSKSQNLLLFNNRPSYERDLCFFSSDGSQDNRGWAFDGFSATKENASIRFKGQSEKNLFREKYAEFYFEAIIDLALGDLEIVSTRFDYWNYK